MDRMLEPGDIARRQLLRRALGASALAVILGQVAHAMDAEIVIDNFTFSPTPFKVKVGTTVTWVNHDDIPHSIVCLDLKVKSHPLDTDETFACKIEQAGTFEYICGLHPHMHGQLVVEA